MPTNLIKKYPELLELGHLPLHKRLVSLRGVFDKDVTNNKFFKFRSKQINPTTQDGEIPLDTLFRHLTTEEVDKKTKKREFEMDRSQRLHWVRYHIEERKTSNVLVFSTDEKRSVRTYIFDTEQNYVIILEPYRSGNEYYMITAYYLQGRNIEKMHKKYKRRLPNVA